MPLNAYFKVCLNSDQKLYVHQHYLNEKYYYFYACLRIQNIFTTSKTPYICLIHRLSYQFPEKSFGI